MSFIIGLGMPFRPDSVRFLMKLCKLLNKVLFVVHIGFNAVVEGSLSNRGLLTMIQPLHIRRQT